MPGLLFDHGRYPVAIPAPRVCQLVHGELWCIRNARRLLPVLDDYEGVTDPRPDYARVQVSDVMSAPSAHARQRTAWTYLWIGGTRGLACIPRGSWRIRTRPDLRC